MPLNGYLFQDKLATFASPTLVKMKVGSLFNVRKEEIPNINDCIAYFNHHLSSHQLRLKVLRERPHSVLIYLYHQDKLKQVLSHPAIHDFLQMYDYQLDSNEKALSCLEKRLVQDEFPHEIGIFLGYPLYDVKQFIESDHPHKCIGCWKVYGNEKNAKKKFSRIASCSEEMKRRIQRGEEIFDTLKCLNA